MIYRTLVTLLLLATTGCWGGEFKSSDDDFFDAGSAGSEAADSGVSTTTGSAGSGGSGAEGGAGGSGSSTATGAAGSGGSGAKGGTGGSGGSGSPATCAPPDDIPQGFVWQEFESVENASCETKATCLNSPCATFELTHTAELEEDPLRLRITFDPILRQVVEIDFSCGEGDVVCYQETFQNTSQVYYLELERTDTGYAAKRFYRWDQEADEQPHRFIVMQKSAGLEQPEYCGWYETPTASLWDDYVDWVTSLEWEC